MMTKVFTINEISDVKLGIILAADFTRMGGRVLPNAHLRSPFLTGISAMSFPEKPMR
jgi:hypothetical protein